ncbi:MAG: extracellular solute-binding protein [Clostridium sp.]|jgi:hypothetical protein|nr:extracellular solute-binding protein [Clostridium sp.]
MKAWKKFTKNLVLGLSLIMAVAVTACGSASNPQTGGESVPAAGTAAAESSSPTAESKDPGDIEIGTWWVQYYDSSHTSLEDDPTYSGTVAAQMKFDVVKKIEEKYGRKFYWQNLTYDGTMESINNSILAGSPDCDIYLVELSFGIPAALNGLALDLKTVLPADSDLFTEQKVARYLDLGDGKATLLKRVEAASTVEATYPLGFHKQMLDNNNLEDPRELYKRGEWTWDKFIEYCQALTQDTDGDGQIDQYGYCGFQNETFEQLLMSNGANVATGTKEELSSSKTGEVLQLISDLYNTYKVCYPYDTTSGDDSTTMRMQYQQGNIGFFPIAAWIAAEKADYDYTGENGSTLEFDTVYVQWPVGPSGDAASNAGKVSAGEFYIIPAGVGNPELVYNVLYDLWNWYEGDASIRDDEDTGDWWYAVTAKDPQLQDENFDTMFEVGGRETFELWNNLGVEYDFLSLISGDTTPAQFQETYKQQVQDALDAYFK